MCVLTGYSITTASFAIYEVNEHHSGSKRLQHIAGISEPFYWAVNFFYDMVTSPGRRLENGNDTVSAVPLPNWCAVKQAYPSSGLQSISGHTIQCLSNTKIASKFITFSFIHIIFSCNYSVLNFFLLLLNKGLYFSVLDSSWAATYK